MIAFLRFLGIAALVAAALLAAMRAIGNDYVFYAGYTVLEYVVLACAWNILGGYVGYVNFGVAAFLVLGAYTGVALGKKKANQASASKSTNPCSCADASAGKLGERLVVNKASAFTVLPSIWGIDAAVPTHW